MSVVNPNDENRYSIEELAEFKVIIEQQLQKTNNALEYILGQVKAVTDVRHEGDLMDDTSNSNDLKMLYTLEARHRKYIGELKNALHRIKNKTYGICQGTGRLIDKRRLLAVPITTKSLEAKITEADSKNKITRPARPSKPLKDSKHKSIVKIKKKPTVKKGEPELTDPIDDFENDLLENESFLESEIDLNIDVDELD
jgi:RNA polymerase-binding protein DksA